MTLFPSAVRLLGAVAMVGSGVAGAADLLPAKDFARHAEYSLARLSPTGEYLAATVPRGRTGIVVIRLSDMKAMTARSFGGSHVSQVWWVGPQRLVMSFVVNAGPLDQPVPNGVLVAMDADGSNTRYVNPEGGRMGFAPSPGMWLEVIAARTDVANEVVVSKNSLYSSIEALIPIVHRVNTATGGAQGVTESPVRGFTYFLADQKGEVRYAVGIDEETLANRTFVRDPTIKNRVKQWSQFGAPRHERSIVPLQFSRDGRRAYLQARDGTDKECLSEHDLDKGAVLPLACHEEADLSRVYFSSDRDVPLAAVFEAGVPEVRWLNPDHPDAKVLRSLQASFQGQVVQPVSWSDDGTKLLFAVYSDRNPGEYFLYDRSKGSAKFLMARREWIDPARMSPVKALKVKVRNGDMVHGYLTLPAKKEAKKLPLVVMPHGGPIGPRDDWAWDSDAQFIASRGYAVLQVNFHGSGGYGYRHLEAGRKVWGTLLIDDITDMVRATIADGTVDAGRICIYGGSYGGYAAVMSATREPELYKCAIPFVGVYDLAKLKRDTDIRRSRTGRTFMDLYIGDDPAVLAEHSPINYLDKLKAPLLIIHGEQDPRAPFNQAELLRDELDKRKLPYEWYTEEDEGHGFYNVDNRVELYEKLQDFLDRHIGERRPAAKP